MLFALNRFVYRLFDCLLSYAARHLLPHLSPLQARFRRYFWTLLGVAVLIACFAFLALGAASGSARRTQYAELMPDAVSCPAIFDVDAAQGPFSATRGPRLWVWWTAPASSPGARTPEESSAWLMRPLAFVRARSSFAVTNVNASLVRNTGSMFFLKHYPLPPYFDALPVNHQGDFGSIALLAEFGGVYVDTDVLLLHDIRPYVALLRSVEFVGFGTPFDGKFRSSQ